MRTKYHFLFKSTVHPEKIKALGGNIQYIGKYSPAVIATFRHPKQIQKLRKDPELIGISRDRPLTLPYYKVEKVFKASVPKNVPTNVSKQVLPWNIARVIGKRRLNSGSGVRVGVIDTGIDFHHPDLKANIKGGVNILSPYASPQDDNGHGTHIAGIIGALNNQFGVVGIAPRVSLYAIKVLNSAGNGTISNLIRGIEWAIANRMHVLNISISGGKMTTPLLEYVIQSAVKRGVIVVAAAGNTGTPAGSGDTVSIPARIEPVISVAALNRNNRREPYSATGKVDLSAPGSQILSTYSYRRFAILSGTSMAAAHVSGALAIYRAAYPRMGSQELKNMLFARAIDLPPEGRDSLTGAGLVQAL
ncbi:S8 family peptidase [Thermoactinomyces mirandus]|uniref:S8 family peptidase n=1 Tax=Thermoactinomyces mirandus TaxID=2756294 RepID=A0A7W1XQK1_9BACL|nr:S8 family peptidase [Thermoactinomyces mirandus]MBA4601424.1 S8 family peptidase [Thermoactinomyces mirandus]